MGHDPNEKSDRLRFTILERFSFTVALVVAVAALLSAGGAVLEAYLQN
ncbi:MAG: hypothetical protein QNJ35_09415 [Paracoccaceae bacterium]|nr:hypothetical protein [Paracoccaceae bacterium]